MPYRCNTAQGGSTSRPATISLGEQVLSITGIVVHCGTAVLCTVSVVTVVESPVDSSRLQVGPSALPFEGSAWPHTSNTLLQSAAIPPSTDFLETCVPMASNNPALGIHTLSSLQMTDVRFD